MIRRFGSGETQSSISIVVLRRHGTLPMGSEKGFTLLEVLAAVALLAISLTVVFQLFSADLQAIASSDDYVAAATRANAMMREVLDDDELTEKSWSELTDDGYRIDVSVQKVLAERSENLQVELLEVAVTASWARGSKSRAITLKSLKLMGKKI